MGLRNNKGQFVKGHEDLTAEQKLKRARSLSERWKQRPDYIGDLVSKNPKIYNVWRSFMFTKKGKRAKASKMISSYKIKDRKNGIEVCDITIDWMISNILTQPCIYCGDKKRVGCDRIDNRKGHTMDNVVPCCIECNTARNNFFSFEEMKEIGNVIREIKRRRKVK